MEEVTFPENVLLDVLLKLPVKTIIYCKCVCKRWRHLVSDPYFVHLHLSRSSHHHEALMIHERMNNNKSIPGTINCVEIEHQADSDYYHLNLVMAINLTVWWTLAYGFGVSMTGEYKVIRLCEGHKYQNLSRSMVYTYEIEVFGIDEWRVLGQVRYDEPNLTRPVDCYSINTLFRAPDPGVVVDNHVYWLLYYAKIYAFDLVTETFEEIASPPESNDQELTRLMLGVLKGRLSRVSWFSFGSLEVWVMKEGSWYKEISIQQVISPILDQSQPLCLVDGLKGTSVLMVQNLETKEVVACCLNTNTIIHLDLRGDISSIMAYRPSFLKLDNFGSQRVRAMYYR
ncbi:hypothetical protein QVD17_14371 [Tagetes erecta]|uniref:F-box domain-containing protein n=1 Tax=Tagetes erecta TaxID=13708 RepID=A0AAD8KWY1_TARER|nr:hypothetical protein QVD17_14371 [Tagetes erecta]